ncbi:sensor domain-containing protein [Streptomyces nogalater]
MTERGDEPAAEGTSRPRARTRTVLGAWRARRPSARRSHPTGAERPRCPASEVVEQRRYLSARGGEWAFAIVGLPCALLGGGYALAALYAGALLSLTVVGLPFVVVALLGARRLGALHRWLVGRLLGEYVEAPARLPRPAGVYARGRVVLTDPVAWRALLYLVLRLPLGVLGFAIAVALPLGCGWLASFPLWIRLGAARGRPPGWTRCPSCWAWWCCPRCPARSGR